jgi:hypothetical protein
MSELSEVSALAPNLSEPDYAALCALGYMAESQLAAALTLKTTRSLWEMRRRKTGIPFSKIGRLILYKISDVQRYIEARKQATVVPRVPAPIRKQLLSMGIGEPSIRVPRSKLPIVRTRQLKTPATRTPRK